MIKAAKESDSYCLIREALANDKDVMNLPPNHPEKPLSNIWNQLSIMQDGLITLDNSRIFVPMTNQIVAYFAISAMTLAYYMRLCPLIIPDPMAKLRF